LLALLEEGLRNLDVLHTECQYQDL
jgi:hypothetical protein